jgi:hypothetical protein
MSVRKWLNRITLERRGYGKDEEIDILDAMMTSLEDLREEEEGNHSGRWEQRVRKRLKT